MDLTQMLPFEKNRYYPGKMLTTPDFKAEQAYLEYRRRFFNQMVLGSGILCGLNVFNLDGLSVLVESGAAVDPLGREIVIGESAVKKLSAVEGYREDADVLSLCLRYREEEIKPVYVVNRKEGREEYENNRIAETYELFLMDARAEGREFRLDSEFFVETEIFRNKDYRLSFKIPADVCRGRKIKFCVEAEQLSSVKKGLDFSLELQFPAFRTLDGSRGMKIEENMAAPGRGRRRTYEYWLYAENTSLKESSVLVKCGKRKETEVKVFLTDEEPDSLIFRSLGRTSLELRAGETRNDYVRLARLYMGHTKSACVLDHVGQEERTYLAVPADEAKRAKYRAFYGDGTWMESSQETQPGTLAAEALPPSGTLTAVREVRPPKIPEAAAYAGTKSDSAGPEQENVGEQEEQEEPGGQGAVQKQAGERTGVAGIRAVASGTLEIPLPEKLRKGGICLSEEIFHGLGRGKVHVLVGINEPDDAAGANKKGRSIVYGETGLFRREIPGTTSVKTAVRVWEDRGCFQVAVKLVGQQNTVLLSADWTAVMLDEEESHGKRKAEKEGEQARIVPKEVTAELKPGQKYFFEVKFENMEPCRLRYELPEEGSGRIDEDGVYTAPLRRGVYEIRIYCEEQPDICTYTYAVVGG